MRFARFDDAREVKARKFFRRACIAQRTILPSPMRRGEKLRHLAKPLVLPRCVYLTWHAPARVDE
jgi:hypothetical protein